MARSDPAAELQAFRDFFENAPIPMHWVDAQGTILRANRAELELLGYAAHEYVGRSITEFHADAPVINDILDRLTRGEVLRDVAARLRCRDGKLKDVLITSSVNRESGRFLNTRCITRDVTEIRRAEAFRSASVDYLEGLMEGFVSYDADWRAVYMNASGERLLGRRRQDVLGKRWLEAFPHAAGNPVDAMYQRVMRTRSPERLEYYYTHYGIWMEISAAPVSSGGIGVYFRDISDRKHAERGLLDEARTLETLNRIGKTLAAELDLERVVQAVTDAATEVSGAAFGAFFYNVTNDAGESYLLYAVSGVEREAFSKFPMPRNTAVFAPTFSGERTVRSDDITRDPRYGKSAPHHGMPPGHLPVKSYLAVPVTSRSGQVLGGLFFGHERPGVFTERAERLVAGIAAQAAVAIDNARLFGDIRRAEEALREADRRKDEFLATLAHELRNPLAPIRNGLHLLRVAGSDPATSRQAREMMERQVGHLVRLVDDLLELSRITRGKVDLRTETLDLAAVVLSAVETSRPAIEAATHRLDISLPAAPIALEADFVRLAQVIANLLNNAAKYTDPGGHIALAVRQEGGEAVVSVRDNGVGIAAEMLPNIFDMFAQGTRTLERAQGGLGIGLSLSRNLVELHGGRIEAKSDGPGRGAEFIVRLPALDGATAEAKKPFVALLHPEEKKMGTDPIFPNR